MELASICLLAMSVSMLELNLVRISLGMKAASLVSNFYDYGLQLGFWFCFGLVKGAKDDCLSIRRFYK